MDFRQIFRTSKKDERITELEAQVARLTDQNTKIAEANQETERILADQDIFIAALKADKMRLEQEVAERFLMITDLRKDVSARDERIRELEHDAAEYDVADDRFVQQIKDLQRDIFHLEADAKEHAQASARYVKEIAESQGECLAIASENSDLIMFVRKCATGANIRTDKLNGAKLVSDARALLKQYDSANVK